MPLKAEIANAIYKGLYSRVLTKMFLGIGFEGDQVPYQNGRAFFILEGFGNKSPLFNPIHCLYQNSHILHLFIAHPQLK